MIFSFCMAVRWENLFIMYTECQCLALIMQIHCKFTEMEDYYQSEHFPLVKIIQNTHPKDKRLILWGFRQTWGCHYKIIPIEMSGYCCHCLCQSVGGSRGEYGEPLDLSGVWSCEGGSRASAGRIFWRHV